VLAACDPRWPARFDARVRYEEVKRDLATRPWRDMNYYAAAEGPVISDILARAGG
jgi:GrpB-like predicted nucleotidyltransferase (UPF0157 family)